MGQGLKKTKLALLHIGSKAMEMGEKDHSEPPCPLVRFGTQPERVTLCSAFAGVIRP